MVTKLHGVHSTTVRITPWTSWFSDKNKQIHRHTYTKRTWTVVRAVDWEWVTIAYVMTKREILGDWFIPQTTDLLTLTVPCNCSDRRKKLPVPVGLQSFIFLKPSLEKDGWPFFLILPVSIHYWIVRSKGGFSFSIRESGALTFLEMFGRNICLPTRFKTNFEQIFEDLTYCN